MEYGTIIEIICYAISIVTGIMIYIIKRKKDSSDNSSADFAVSLMVVLIGFFLTSYATIRFIHLQEIVDNQTFIKTLKTDNEVLRITTDLSKAKELMKNENNPFFEAVLTHRKNEFKGFLENYQNKELIYNRKDFHLFEQDVIKIFTESGMSQTILATSRVDFEQWWKKENFGAEYDKANFDCIKNKGVAIRRIFIFDEEAEMQKHIETLKSQKNAGVEVRYVFNRDIKEIVERKRDIIVVGDIHAGELILNDKDMVKVVFYFDDIKMKEIKNDWFELNKKSIKF